MTFVRGLLTARGHLAFLAGLAAAFATVRAVDHLARPTPARSRAWDAAAIATAGPRLRDPGPLRPAERELARAAWSYVERNADPTTGLAGAAAGHPVATLWEVGAQLMAILSAEDLGLVTEAGASHRLARALATIGRLPLCDGILPARAYDVRTLAMVDPDGHPDAAGSGWSALDVARVLGALSLVAWRHPELAREVRDAVGRWRLDALVEGGELRGAVRGPDGRLAAVQEGRLGYEQLAAKDLLAWGLPVAPLLQGRAHAEAAEVDGVTLPQDDRAPATHGGARAPLLSEPWILDGLERGLDAATLPVARALLVVQERRFLATGRLTAVSEDHLDRPPWFAYGAVLDGDDRWSARAADGSPAPGALTFSTKAAVAWGVLFEGEYADRLLEAATALAVRGQGIYAGRYDATGELNRALSLNTSAVVLEALAYRVRGPARAPRPGAARPVEARR